MAFIFITGIILIILGTMTFVFASNYGYNDVETGSLIYKNEQGKVIGVEDEVRLVSRLPTNKELQTGEYEEPLAYCLASKGVVLYYRDDCPYCAEQKRLFGNEFEMLNKVDCNKEDCSNIQGVPTWKFGEEYISGLKSLDQIAQLGGCN